MMDLFYIKIHIFHFITSWDVLHILHLFNDAISSYYIAPNDRINNKFSHNILVWEDTNTNSY